MDNAFSLSGGFPAQQVKVFGSFATGLYLPTSDVDVRLPKLLFGNGQ